MDNEAVLGFAERHIHTMPESQLRHLAVKLQSDLFLNAEQQERVDRIIHHIQLLLSQSSFHHGYS